MGCIVEPAIRAPLAEVGLRVTDSVKMASITIVVAKRKSLMPWGSGAFNGEGVS